MLPRKVKRNHDLSHSNNCALFWAEKVRMTAQENLLSKAPSGWERYRVDAAVLEPGNLFLLPRLCFGEFFKNIIDDKRSAINNLMLLVVSGLGLRRYGM